VVTNNLLFFLTKYSDYFHDGSVYKIEHRKKGMIIWAESAELLPEWYWDRKNIPLSKRNTISGKLHLEGIVHIRNDQGVCIDALSMMYEFGDIFDLEIKKNKIRISVVWKKFKPIKMETEMIEIEIQARSIFWENIPDLFDQRWEAE